MEDSCEVLIGITTQTKMQELNLPNQVPNRLNRNPVSSPLPGWNKSPSWKVCLSNGNAGLQALKDSRGSRKGRRLKENKQTNGKWTSPSQFTQNPNRSRSDQWNYSQKDIINFNNRFQSAAIFHVSKFWHNRLLGFQCGFFSNCLKPPQFQFLFITVTFCDEFFSFLSFWNKNGKLKIYLGVR